MLCVIHIYVYIYIYIYIDILCIYIYIYIYIYVRHARHVFARRLSVEQIQLHYNIIRVSNLLWYIIVYHNVTS